MFGLLPLTSLTFDLQLDLLSWQKNLMFPACLCPINTLLFLPFGRQMEALMLSFLLFVSSCFCSLFIFPNSTIACCLGVFGLNLL